MKKIILVLMIAFLGITSMNAQAQKIIKYVVESNSPFFITYVNSDGNTEQKTVYSNKWSVEYISPRTNFVYVSAQTEEENSNISVKILCCDHVVEEANSRGDYVIASASGNIDDYPYKCIFKGEVKTYTFSKIYKTPDMDGDVICEVSTKVNIIKKINDSYYKIIYYDEKNNTITGYMWVGSFK
jgi:hypothetical protein